MSGSRAGSHVDPACAPLSCSCVPVCFNRWRAFSSPPLPAVRLQHAMAAAATPQLARSWRRSTRISRRSSHIERTRPHIERMRRWWGRLLFPPELKISSLALAGRVVSGPLRDVLHACETHPRARPHHTGGDTLIAPALPPPSRLPSGRVACTRALCACVVPQPDGAARASQRESTYENGIRCVSTPSLCARNRPAVSD